MSKVKSIQITKPDKTRSCLSCRKGLPPPSPGGDNIVCLMTENVVPYDTAQTCEHFKDSRTTFQVISAGGRAFA